MGKGRQMVNGWVNVTDFDNGAYLYSVRYSLVNLSALGFRSGSIHDPKGKSGLNHFVEHTVHRRGRHHTGRDVERLMNRYLGGSHGNEMNVRCDRTSVLYAHDDVRREEDMWKLFHMNFDLVTSAMMDAEGQEPRVLDSRAIAIEKPAVENEYRVHGTDSLQDLVYDLVHWRLYKSNPARKRVDCARKELRKMKLSDVRQFIRDRYTTETMFAVMIGPKMNEAVDKVRDYIGDLPHRSPAPFPYDHSDDVPMLDGVLSYELVRPGIRQHHVGLGFPTETYCTDDAEVLDVLNALWEQRIERRLREENTNPDGGIYHPNVYTPRTLTHGMIMGWFATQGDSAYMERAIAMALEEAEKLKTDESVQFAEDIEDRKGYMEDEFMQLRIYPLVLCELIVEATCNGDPTLERLDKYMRRLHKVTPKKVREAARKYFTTDRFARVVIKPLIVPQDVIDRASDEARPYLEAINHDPDFGSE